MSIIDLKEIRDYIAIDDASNEKRPSIFGRCVSYKQFCISLLKRVDQLQDAIADHVPTGLGDCTECMQELKKEE